MRPLSAPARACCATLALLAASSPLPSAAAESAVTCHCFREREYTLEAPAAADPYILATTRSSTLAAVYGVDKAVLVRTVMKGTAAEDLWIAYWAGARLGRDASVLLQAKLAAGSWRAVLGPEHGPKLGAAMTDALARGASDAELAGLAVDDAVVSSLRAPPEVVRLTRAAGASSPEVILALLLAPRLQLGPPEILALAKKGGRSWGALLSDAAIKPDDLDEVVTRAVKPPTQPWLLGKP
jgi:hypothetical protein